MLAECAQKRGLELADPLVDAIIGAVSNWGRWGEEDELGTVNFITPAARREAARLVQNGKTFSLALPFGDEGPQPAGDRRLNPHHVMLQTGTDVASGVQEHSVDGSGYADDMVTMALQCGTQWDGLAHAFYAYRMYNNRDCALVTATGAQANSIDRLRDLVIGRGVLADVARFIGVDWLEPGHEITIAELKNTLQYQRVSIQRGDVLLLRTGHLKHVRRDGGWAEFVHYPEPGIGLNLLPWIHDLEIAAAAADNWAFEVLPNESSLMFPVHAAAIVHMGLLIGEMFDLDALAEDCAADQRFEFLFCAPPLPFTKAVGSPVNPIAVK